LGNEILMVMAVVAAAGFIHSAAGFGAAMVAMPALTLLLGIQTSAPLVALTGLITAPLVLLQNRRGLDIKEAGRLILASLLGIPLGVLALKQLDEQIVTGFLGIVLIGYASYTLYVAFFSKVGATEGVGLRVSEQDELLSDSQRRPACWAGVARPPGLGELEWGGFREQAGAWIVGFLAGILGGAYNTNGPPLIIYGAIKKWPQERFKSILQSLFLSNTVLIVGGHAVAGSITPAVWQNYLYAVLPLLAGIFLGFRVAKRLNPDRFRKLALVLILLSGVSLLVL